MMKKIALLSLLSFALCNAAHAQVIVNETFESYADDAAMQAAWVSNTGSTTQTFLFDETTPSQPYAVSPDPGAVDGKAVLFDGTTGGFNKWGGAFAIAPTATQNVVLSADLAHDMLTSNKRLSVGLRYTGAVSENLIELGFWNGLPLGPNGEFFQFGYRTVLMPGSTNWQPYSLPTNKDQLFEIGDAAFHTFTATISVTDVTFTLDLFGDGINNGTGLPGLDATNVVAAVTTANGYNDLRFGGPSGVTSADPFLGVDNISLSLVDVVIEPPTGNADFDGDGDVDGRDFLIWQRTGLLDDGTGSLADGDANGDGNVDSDDLIVWQDQYGEVPALSAITSVPEPTSAVLLGMALSSLALLKRR